MEMGACSLNTLKKNKYYVEFLTGEGENWYTVEAWDELTAKNIVIDNYKKEGIHIEITGVSKVGDCCG